MRNCDVKQVSREHGLYQGLHPYWRDKDFTDPHHEHPFGNLYSHFNLDGPRSSDELLLNKCFFEYYYEAYPYPDGWVETMKNIKDELTESIVKVLLGNLGWRQRRLGAYYMAVGEHHSLMDILGVHLLKSEMPFAGYNYLIAIAYLNNEKGLNYLLKYLNFYLTQTQLEYDQIQAIETLVYLDHKNKTDYFKEVEFLWNDYLLNSRIGKFFYGPDKQEINFSWLTREIKILESINEN